MGSALVDMGFLAASLPPLAAYWICFSLWFPDVILNPFYLCNEDPQKNATGLFHSGFPKVSGALFLWKLHDFK
jgi:hypothetical protein